MNKRWLLTRDGKEFVKAVATHIASMRGLAASTMSTGDPVTDWAAVKAAFFLGLEAVYGSALSTAARAPFHTKVDYVYEARFDDGYDTLPDGVGTVVAQAQTVGILTGYMYKLHHGDVGRYPGADPNVTLSYYHLDWARDFLGFWILGRTRWEIPITPDTPQDSSTLGEEFDNGCSLC